MKKTCPTCNIEKPIEGYNKNKTRKDGHQRECRECTRSHHNKHYQTKKSPRLKERLKPDHKRCTTCKKQYHISLFNKQGGGRFGVSSTCKSCISIRFKKWWDDGGKKYNLEYVKDRKKNDPEYKLQFLTRLRVNEVLKRENITKNHSGLEYLGCDVKTYKEHLESQFTTDMTWDNHGTYWEIDHIIPLSKGGTFHYTNTQPLTKSQNRIKGSSI